MTPCASPASVQAEQQDRFPEKGELCTLITFFNSRRHPALEAARAGISANADVIVAKAANRIFAGGTPLPPISTPPHPCFGEQSPRDGPPGCRPRLRAARLCAPSPRANRRLPFARPAFLKGFRPRCRCSRRAPAGFSPISVARLRAQNRMAQSLRRQWAGSFALRGLWPWVGRAIPASLR